jgi:diaminopimelate decarboxylase
MDLITTKDNVLYFDGCNTVELAKEFGTPLYLMSENAIIERCKELKSMFLDKYDNTRVAYASKAFLTLAMCKIIERQGLSLDVVSGGELFTAIKANFPASRIELHGNNKTYEELDMAMEYGIKYIIVNYSDELDLIEEVCAKHNRDIEVLFRISPEVSIDSHKFISTGKRKSKFGFTLDKDIIFPAIKRVKTAKHVKFMGFHFHIGSQLFENESHLKALKVILNLAKDVKTELNIDIEDLNIGGGFGINYTEADDRKPYSFFLDPIMEEVIKFTEANNMKRPKVVIEPGRSIVGESGMTLYTVGSIKDIPGIRKYIAVDGGMPDNIRPALYEAKYEGVIANKADEPKDDMVAIAGKCCESGDILIKDGYFAKAERGDILAIFATGAYGYSMANNYNKLPFPAVVLVNGGNAEVIVRRQTNEDLLRNDVIPQRFSK